MCAFFNAFFPSWKTDFEWGSVFWILMADASLSLKQLQIKKEWAVCFESQAIYRKSSSSQYSMLTLEPNTISKYSGQSNFYSQLSYANSPWRKAGGEMTYRKSPPTWQWVRTKLSGAFRAILLFLFEGCSYTPCNPQCHFPINREMRKRMDRVTEGMEICNKYGYAAITAVLTFARRTLLSFSMSF